jgi:hypothetical protein
VHFFGPAGLLAVTNVGIPQSTSSQHNHCSVAVATPVSLEGLQTQSPASRAVRRGCDIRRSSRTFWTSFTLSLHLPRASGVSASALHSALHYRFFSLSLILFLIATRYSAPNFQQAASISCNEYNFPYCTVAIFGFVYEFETSRTL